MGRATVDGRVFPAPGINGLQTAGGSGYSGERKVQPYTTPASWLARIMCPIPRIDFSVYAGFNLQPVNRRAGGPDV